jgi:hypothetical protein
VSTDLAAGVAIAPDLTLSANTVLTVNFTGRWRHIRVSWDGGDGSHGLIVRTDGTDPVTDAPARGAHYLPPLPSSEDFDIAFDTRDNTQIKLKSVGAGVVTVAGLDV